MRLPRLRRAASRSARPTTSATSPAILRQGTLDPLEWPALDDEALIERLTDVKGIGRWTAEMFLIFHEMRADVFPVGDIGLQNAIARHYNDDERLVDRRHARDRRSVAAVAQRRVVVPVALARPDPGRVLTRIDVAIRTRGGHDHIR